MAVTVYPSDGAPPRKEDKRADIDTLDRQSAPDGDGPDVVEFWKGELGRYQVEFKPWEVRCEKIIRRYRDERDEATRFASRFNILWSNIQTLWPAVYSKMAQPIVERRYLDKDPIGRLASQMLERATETNLEIGRAHEAAQKATLDYLLCGRGQLWARYEPEYGFATAQITGTSENAGPDDIESDGDEQDQPDTEVTWEKVCTDYVYWGDFAHSAARIWPEVWWVARRAWLSREEGEARFGSVFRRIALKKPGLDMAGWDGSKRDRAPRAEVWEIWDKVSQEVFFFAPDMPSKILERVPDPLRLQGFFPCPEPLYATLTNGTLVPVPDYTLYQDQAEEIDSLTNRISRLSAAIKAAGWYDGSVTELGRLLNVSVDNQMIAVNNWMALAEKGGVGKSVEFLPILEMANTLKILYESREAAKHDLYEITGISDLIRGQGAASATATASRIEGNFASLRLDSRRKAVARFMRDNVAITAEIIAEHFSPEILVQMTGMMPVIMEEVKSAMPPSPPPQPALPPPQGGAPAGMVAGHGSTASAPQPPMQTPSGGPGMGAQMPPPNPQSMQMPAPAGMGGGGATPPAPPPPDPQQIAVQVMGKILELLRNDKMRTFRIDIETDSHVEADAISGKEEVSEFMAATAQFLTAALPLGQMAPPLIKPLAQSMQYAMRRFKMGRNVEAAFDAAFDELEQQSKQPKGPDPALALEEAKGKIELSMLQAKMQADQQKTQQDAQAAAQKAQMEMQKAQADMAVEQGRLRIKAQELQLDRERIEMERAAAAEAHRYALEKMAMQAKLAAEKPSGGAQA